MRTSVFLAASGAILAAASPVVLEDRALHIKTEVVIQYVTVTVTEEPGPATVYRGRKHSRLTTTSTSSSTPETTSEPTTSMVASIVLQSSNLPAPEPATSEPAPIVVAPSESKSIEKTPPSSSSAPPAPTVVDSSSDYASVAVQSHNIHRMNHSAPAMSWGATYADYAAQTAATCVFKHDLTPGGGGYGQNLAMWGNSFDALSYGANKAVAQSTTDFWYNDEFNSWPAADYSKANPNFSNFENWGHFSQVIWKDSVQVGCHSQFCAKGTMSDNMDIWFTVCNYYPAGNVGGEYGTNVLPPLGQAVVTA